MGNVRPEIHTRINFAKTEGLNLFEKMKNVQGNVMGCAYIDKLAQARRIIKHYQREFIKALE